MNNLYFITRFIIRSYLCICIELKLKLAISGIEKNNLKKIFLKVNYN